MDNFVIITHLQDKFSTLPAEATVVVLKVVTASWRYSIHVEAN